MNWNLKIFIKEAWSKWKPDVGDINFVGCVGGTNPTANSLIILLEPRGLYKLGARLRIRLNAAR
jgi:hypothetical protein